MGYTKISFFFILVFIACTSVEKKEEQAPKITNPNGMSGMSLLMEEWYNLMTSYERDLRAHATITKFINLNEDKVRTAEMSKPKQYIREEQAFNAFTSGFFYNYHEIGEGKTFQDQVNAFNSTVNACINCHEQYCHGPIVRIQKLLIKE